MKRRTVLLGLAAIAVAAILIWSRGEERAPRPEVHAAAERVDHRMEEQPRGPREEVRAEAPAPEPIEEKAEAPSDARGRQLHLNGIVLEDGAPVPDALVRAHSSWDELVTTRSGADGRFAIDVRARGFLQLDALKGENLRGSAGVFMSGEPPKEVRIELARAGLVVVTVTSRREQGPVQHARVSCAHRQDGDFVDEQNWARELAERAFGPVETGADGKATLFILKAGKYEVEAEHDEIGNVVGEFELVMKDEPQQIALELRGGSAILGLVVDDARAPVPDIEVMLAPERGASQLGYRRGVSDAQGRFRIAGVEAGTYELSAHPEKYPPVQLSIEKKDDTNDMEVELVLARAATIEGRVLDAHDAPLPAWTVYAWGESRHGVRKATSRADGSFVVEGCAEGAYMLTAQRSGELQVWRIFERSKHRTRAKAGDRGVIVRGSAGATLAGVVRFEGAEPPASYKVSIAGQYREEPATSPSFRISELAAGNDRATVTAPGFAAASEDVTLTDEATTEVSFTLHPEARLTGRVVDARAGSPIAGAIVNAVRTEAERSFPDTAIEGTKTAADGSFTVRGLSPGPVRLLVAEEAHQPAIAGPFAVSAEAAPVVVRLQRGVTVSGRVHRGKETPSWGEASVRPGEEWLLRRSAPLERDGSFAIHGVAPGKLVLAADALIGSDQSSESRELSIDVPAGGLFGVDVDFAPADGVRLIVALPPALEQVMHVVLIEGHVDLAQRRAARPTEVRKAEAGATEVRFDGVRPGEYTLFSITVTDLFSDEDRASRWGNPIYVTIKPGDREVRAAIPPR